MEISSSTDVTSSQYFCDRTSNSSENSERRLPGVRLTVTKIVRFALGMALRTLAGTNWSCTSIRDPDPHHK